MADATLQILGLGTGAVPVDYNVTGNQALDLIAVKADFDGTSALVDFVPIVEILSDADHVMAQAKGPTVTAGDSATVTFAPFLNDLDTGGGSGAGVIARQIMSFTTPNNPAGTDGGAVFTNSSGDALFDAAAGVLNPPCLVGGTYTFVVYGQGNGNWNNGGSYNVQWQIMDTTGFSYFLYTLVGPFGAAAFAPGMSMTTANPMLVGDTFQLDWHNGDTAGAHTFGGTLWIVRTGG